MERRDYVKLEANVREVRREDRRDRSTKARANRSALHDHP